MSETYSKVFSSPINKSKSKQLYSFGKAKRFDEMLKPKYEVCYSAATSSTTWREDSPKGPPTLAMAIRFPLALIMQFLLQGDMSWRGSLRIRLPGEKDGVSVATGKKASLTNDQWRRYLGLALTILSRITMSISLTRSDAGRQTHNKSTEM